MIVGYGRTCEKGSLPVFTVADEEEAHELLTQACARNAHGQFVTEELAVDQTLENLQRFSHRLYRHHELLEARGSCRCKKVAP